MLPKPDYGDESESAISEEETPFEPKPDYGGAEISSILHLYDAKITVPIPPKDYNIHSDHPHTIVRSKSSQQLRRFPSISTNADSTLVDDYVTRSELNYAHSRSYPFRASLATTERKETEQSRPIIYSTNTTASTVPFFEQKRNSLGNLIRTGWTNGSTILTTTRALVTWQGSNTAELNINKGEELLVLEKRNVWWRCKNANNEIGWVPAEFLTRM